MTNNHLSATHCLPESKFLFPTHPGEYFQTIEALPHKNEHLDLTDMRNGLLVNSPSLMLCEESRRITGRLKPSQRDLKGQFRRDRSYAQTNRSVRWIRYFRSGTDYGPAFPRALQSQKLWSPTRGAAKCLEDLQPAC